MVNFLRKKGQTPTKPVATRTSPTPVQKSEHTPLYSKFASSTQDVGRSGVSGPVMLGSQREARGGYNRYGNGSDTGHNSRPRDMYAEPMQARPRTNPIPSHSPQPQRSQAIPMPQEQDPYSSPNSHRTSQFSPETSSSPMNKPALRSRPSINSAPSASRDSMARPRNSQNFLPDAETTNMYSSYLDMMFPPQTTRTSVYTNGNSEDLPLQSKPVATRRHSQIQSSNVGPAPETPPRINRKTSNPPPVRRGPLIFATAAESDPPEPVVPPRTNAQPSPTPRTNGAQQHRVSMPPGPREIAPNQDTSSPAKMRHQNLPSVDPFARESRRSPMPPNPPAREQATPSPMRMPSQRSNGHVHPESSANLHNAQIRSNSTPLGPRGEARETKRLSRVAVPAVEPVQFSSPAAPPSRELDTNSAAKPAKVNGYGTPPRPQPNMPINGRLDNAHASPARKVLTKQKPPTPDKQRTVPQERPPSTFNASFGVDLRDDPFAKPAPVRIAPSSRDGHRALPEKPAPFGRESMNMEDSSPSMHSHTFDPYEEVERASPAGMPVYTPPSPRYKGSLPPLPPQAAPVQARPRQLTPPSATPSPRPKTPPQEVAPTVKSPSPVSPRTLPTPEEHLVPKAHRRADKPAKRPISSTRMLPVRPDRRAEPFPLDIFLSDPGILTLLLSYFSFYDWCMLSSTSKVIRTMLSDNVELKEVVLEKFLKTIGYARWTSASSDPLPLTLQDLHDYMHGVSIPTYQYGQIAQNYLQSLGQHPSQRDGSVGDKVRALRAAARAYTRVVLRLRAQLEKDARAGKSARAQTPPRGSSRSLSRPATPTSIFSHGHGPPRPSTPSGGLSSPLFRLRRAPLLRVYVPSSNGEWLSDSSVLDCEEELKKAGVLNLLRTGDVVWDVAVGDEGNAGRLIWDGSYLLDLDYSFSRGGDLPKYIPTMAFPPSYFHKSIRPGSSSSNPIVRVDISQWGDQIAANLQLLQDRVRTETPQGTFHNVMRWVHRSSFFVRPPPGGRVPLRGSHNQSLFVDSGWHGSVIVETEGTNESLADLQDRCGSGVFPPRATGSSSVKLARDPDDRMVFKVMRERSRPGEIWLWAVSPKEKLV